MNVFVPDLKRSGTEVGNPAPRSYLVNTGESSVRRIRSMLKEEPIKEEEKTEQVDQPNDSPIQPRRSSRETVKPQRLIEQF